MREKLTKEFRRFRIPAERKTTRKQAKSECGWMVTSSVFVASQSSFIQRKEIRLLGNQETSYLFNFIQVWAILNKTDGMHNFEFLKLHRCTQWMSVDNRNVSSEIESPMDFAAIPQI